MIMQEPLYKLLHKRTPNAEKIPPEAITYEELYPQYAVSINGPQTLIGIEIEVEKFNDVVSIPEYMVWQVRADNSLRDGIEFVSLPIKGRRVHYALNLFYDKLSKKAVFSPRTSVHIHVNVLDLAPAQIGNVVALYVLVEKLLYKFVGHERDKNNFCVPMGDADCARDVINPLWNVSYKDGFTSPVGEAHRYLGLNVHSLIKFGTLEFRHLEGTRNKERIIQWINLILCLKGFGERVATDDLKQKINKLNTESTYLALVKEIFGEHAYLLDQSNLQKDMERAVSELKALTIVNKHILKYSQPEKVGDSYWYSLLRKKKVTTGMFVDVGGRRPEPAERPAPPRRADQVRGALDRNPPRVREVERNPARVPLPALSRAYIEPVVINQYQIQGGANPVNWGELRDMPAEEDPA